MDFLAHWTSKASFIHGQWRLDAIFMSKPKMDGLKWLPSIRFARQLQLMIHIAKIITTLIIAPFNY